MERGLLWLPLLGVFIGLTWAGWNEYQKLQAYERWATQFERSKYDIRAVLGQQGSDLTWGQPTRRGPVELSHLSLTTVTALILEADGQAVDPALPLPSTQRPELRFELSGNAPDVTIPFTDIELALAWFNHLQSQIQQLQSAAD